MPSLKITPFSAMRDSRVSGVSDVTRHGHQRRGRRVVKEGESQTFADDVAAAVLQQVGGGLNLDELDAEHNVPFAFVVSV